MTPKERAAMQQALEALENAYENGFLTGIIGLKTIDIITAVREALAGVNMSPTEQAEQEPVGYVDEALRIKWLIDYDAVSKLTGHKLYAAPVRTKDLTDAEIRSIRFNWERNEFAIDFARAVIAAYKEKNRG